MSSNDVEKPIGVEQPESPVKIGYFESPAQDGTYTAFLQLRGLPNQQKAIEAGEWFANMLLAASESPSAKEMN